MGLPFQQLLCMGGSAVLAIFFTIFVVAMMCDQREAVETDTTAIESNVKEINHVLYNWVPKELTTGEGLRNVCGEAFGISWFIPTPVPNRYKWHPLDSPDAWDPRDPRIVAHFKDLEKRICLGKGFPVVPPPGEGESLYTTLKNDYLAALTRLEKGTEWEGWVEDWKKRTNFFSGVQQQDIHGNDAAANGGARKGAGAGGGEEEELQRAASKSPHNSGTTGTPTLVQRKKAPRD
jgi:hypothetical protein